MMRQMKLADGDFNIDSEVILPPENLNHTAPRILRGRGPVRDFNVHHHTFEAIPLEAASSLIAQHAVHRFWWRRPL